MRMGACRRRRGYLGFAVSPCHSGLGLDAGKRKVARKAPMGQRVCFPDWGESGNFLCRCSRRVEMSLLKRAGRGLREMPSNAGWAVSQVRGSSRSWGAGEEGAVQLQMKRAEDAGERAREAEEQAVQAAQEAEELSDYALEVTRQGRAHIKKVNRDTERELEQRI